MNTPYIMQTPETGTHKVYFCGDTVTFKMTAFNCIDGQAWVRTNIGHAKVTKKEVIDKIYYDKPAKGLDWFDIPMKKNDKNNFSLTLPLSEVGHFGAKCFFLQEGESLPFWPEGSNTIINVEPADTCCANIIYNAFIRQFGVNKYMKSMKKKVDERFIKVLDQAGYAVIPPSGTFRDFIKELDFIVGELGCRIIYLLPINPTPTTYGRMGRFGSPYASLDFKAVDPSLAEFDQKQNHFDQFSELIDEVHKRNAKMFLDLVINHTGWSSFLCENHPNWFAKEQDGSFEVPGAWGVLWADLIKLDYSHKNLWKYIADVFLTWCKRGVDGFRCDAGYMIPVPVWKFIIATVRSQYPNTIFFLEGLGGKISVTRDILNVSNLNWAYSELFQNYDRNQIENYLPQAIEISNTDGIMVHFAETHDNNRLAAKSKTYAKMRTALCALLSVNGAFGFANGVEWFADEKIDVHEASSLNWGSEINQVDHIRRLNLILKYHPTFYDKVNLQLIENGIGNYVVLLRYHIPTGKKLIIIANLDDQNPSLCKWDKDQTGIKKDVLIDLISQESISIVKQDKLNNIFLQPGQVLCLTEDKQDLNLINNAELENKKNNAFILPNRILVQRLKAKVLQVYNHFYGVSDISSFDIEKYIKLLQLNPRQFLLNFNNINKEPMVFLWKWPQDLKRKVMVPVNNFLLVVSSFPHRAEIVNNKTLVAVEESLYSKELNYFSLFLPEKNLKKNKTYTLNIQIYTDKECIRQTSKLLYLSKNNNLQVKRYFTRYELIKNNKLMLATNGRGAMLRANVEWGNLHSVYDGLLAANLNQDYPEDRWMMFTRCRAWVVFHDFSTQICKDCLHSFYLDETGGYWNFNVPTGQGQHVFLTIKISLLKNLNTVTMDFYRHPQFGEKKIIEDIRPIKLILCPDIENRSFHATVKAFCGPEHDWPNVITCKDNGYLFEPDNNHILNMEVSKGKFNFEPKWEYQIDYETEAQRGLSSQSDLFSPGHFIVFLKGDQSKKLVANVYNNKDDSQKNIEEILSEKPDLKPYFKSGYKKEISFKKALEISMDNFVVKRGKFKTVIAGYPWFLDWGRDSLIFTRGLIAQKKLKEARDVLMQFGRFEEDGTLPNAISGDNASNRDTSDAQLWYCVSCADLLEMEKSDSFLYENFGKRNIFQTIVSIAQSIIKGTKNGIYMDKNSGLVYSPSHFTWMDTNYPACTPKQGYAIEIQALWYATLKLLSKIDPDEKKGDWTDLLQKVRYAISDLFYLKGQGYLSDCLHANNDVTANEAIADDALRPNQLFAITLGALDVIDDFDICKNILNACEELIIPGAIRSLADRKVDYPIEANLNGTILNNPNYPYQGQYLGDEDTKRKPAYHNGTAWSWVFPSFCEAYIKVYGKKAKDTAMSILSSSIEIINNDCIGNISEVFDGDYPHTSRGCDAQAWGTSEVLRVLNYIENLKD